MTALQANELFTAIVRDGFRGIHPPGHTDHIWQIDEAVLQHGSKDPRRLIRRCGDLWRAAKKLADDGVEPLDAQDAVNRATALVEAE